MVQRIEDEAYEIRQSLTRSELRTLKRLPFARTTPNVHALRRLKLVRLCRPDGNWSPGEWRTTTLGEAVLSAPNAPRVNAQGEDVANRGRGR